MTAMEEMAITMGLQKKGPASQNISQKMKSASS